MLSHMSKAFADLSVNIDTAKCLEAKDGRADNLAFHAQDLEQVQSAPKAPQGAQGVYSVERVSLRLSGAS